MKIRNTIKGLAFMGATAALLPLGSAMAAGPGFDGINVLNGTTGTLGGCPTAAAGACNILITGEGFLQQEVVVGGQTYIQTVIIDPLAAGATGDTDVTTLDFSDITFIQMAGASSGIKGLQTLSDQAADIATTGNRFDASTELLIGWAEETGKSNLNVTQAFYDNGNTGKVQSTGVTDASQQEDDFFNSFTLGVNLDAAGATTGKAMDMVQDVGMSAGGSGGTDFQRFVVRERAGDALDSSGTLTLVAVPGSAGTGGSLAWTQAATPSDSDDVMVAWLGQRVGLGGLGVSTFGFQSLDNKSDALDPISTFSTSSADVTASPFSWDAGMVNNFGAAPVLP